MVVDTGDTRVWFDVIVTVFETFVVLDEDIEYNESVIPREAAKTRTKKMSTIVPILPTAFKVLQYSNSFSISVCSTKRLTFFFV
jgi:hypothetical protein